MESFDGDQQWLLITVVAIGAYLLGRMSAGGTGENRVERQMRERQAAEDAYSELTSSNQADIDRLVMEGKIIEAVKLVREHTGLGLKDSKGIVDSRRRALKGSG